MSMYLTAAAFKLKVGNPLRKLVLLKLADNADEDGQCFPSYKRIANDCEISRSSVIAHIAWLESVGIVSKKERYNQVTNSSNMYKMNFEFSGKDVVIIRPNGDRVILENGDLSALTSTGDELGGIAAELGGAGDELGGGSGDEPIINHTINQSINHIHNTSSDDDAAPVIKPVRKKKTAPVNEIINAYNEVLGDVLPKAIKPSAKRTKMITDRWYDMLNSQHPDKDILRYTDNESGIAWWKAFFSKVKLRPHWLGDNESGWAANLDWIIKEDNFIKVLEFRPVSKK